MLSFPVRLVVVHTLWHNTPITSYIGVPPTEFYFCKNTINFAEPQIFLTSGWYAISHISRPSPSEDLFKLHFRMKAFFSNSQIYFNVNIS